MASSYGAYLWDRSWSLDKVIDKEKLKDLSSGELSQFAAKELLKVAMLALGREVVLTQRQEDVLVNMLVNDPIKTLSIFPRSVELACQSADH